MKVVVLTTETMHHAYFVREIAARFDIARVFIERTGIAAPFETAHAFEHAREQYEQAYWFDGEAAKIAQFADVTESKTINDASVVSDIRSINPDAIIVFGTRPLGPAIIDIAPDRIFNLHGADPQKYRGLDSHLWAIYHRDFDALETTLHVLNAKLDDGAIVGTKSLKIHKGMPLHALRQANTEVCVALVTEALNELQTHGRIASSAQVGKGRYYSFMPAVLKDICVRRFENHTEKLR